MEFRLLGPLEVFRDGEPLPLGGKQRRTVLSILLVHAGETVSTEKVIDELWGDSPPDAARKTVQAHIAHLRRALNDESELLVGAPNGYRLLVDPDHVDSHLFERLVEDARVKLPQDPRAAVQIFDEALALFRGEPLAGLADNAFSLRVEATRIEEVRLAAIENRIEAQLAIGDHAGAISEARSLLSIHPLRERLWGLLMLALYRMGRQGEALRAFSEARLALADQLGILPSTELRELEQRILEQDPMLLERQSRVPGQAAPRQYEVVRNPYKGLRAFDEADAADFFGREDLVRRLLERIDAREGPHLAVLAGPSGAGKSSVVRAGLIPALRDRGLEVATLFPGSDPVTALAKSVAEATDRSPADVDHDMATNAVIPFDGVIFVDQFEEIYTMSASQVEVDRFLTLISEPGILRSVVVTVRADFLDRLLSHPQTGGLLDDALVLIPPLQEHEITAAVVNPARRVGVEVEPELVRAIVGDVQARAAALPLLQFALTDTFERRAENTVRTADYENAGGISGALSRRAEELYKALGHQKQEAARQLFLHLVAVTEEGERAKRRIAREALRGLASPSDLEKILERFGTQRLLTFDQDPDSRKPTVEVAHEALISEWPRLAAWVVEAHDDLQKRRRLTAAAAEWVQSGRQQDFLLTGRRLIEMESWRGASLLALPPNELVFLEESRKREDSAARRTANRRRLIAGTLSVIAAVAVVFAVVARNQTRLATVRQLAASAGVTLADDPELSALLAIEAVRRSGSEVLPEALGALHEAVLADRLVASVPNGGISVADLAPDGRSFLTTGADPTTLQTWSLDPVKPLSTFEGHTAPVVDATFDGDGRRIASASEDGTVRVWDVSARTVDLMIDLGGDTPNVPRFSPDGGLLASSTDEGRVHVWDSNTGDAILTLEPHSGIVDTRNVDINADGSLLVAAAERVPLVFIWDLTTGEVAEVLEGHVESVKAVEFTPDGTRLLTGSFDGTVRIWDTATWQTEAVYEGLDTSVWELAISPDGTTVAASGNNLVSVWDLHSLRTRINFVAHSGIVDGVDFDAESGMLLTASLVDGKTRVWDTTPQGSRELLSLPGSAGVFGDVAFSPNGEIVAASRGFGGLSLWDFPSGQEIDTYQLLDVIVDGIAFDPQGDRLAYGGNTLLEGGAGLVDYATGVVTILVDGVQSADAAFSPSGGVALSAGTQVRVWSDGFGGDPDYVLDFEQVPLGLAFDPGGEMLVVAANIDPPNYLAVFRVEDGHLLRKITEDVGLVRRIAWSPDGEWFATASLQSTLDIWSGSQPFEHLRRIEPLTGQVLSVAVNPAKDELAVGGDDGSIRLINPDTGAVTLTLRPPTLLGSVAYSPDGRYLAGTGPGDLAMVFILDVDELVSVAESRLTRWWTESECLQYLQTSDCPPVPDNLNPSIVG